MLRMTLDKLPGGKNFETKIDEFQNDPTSGKRITYFNTLKTKQEKMNFPQKQTSALGNLENFKHLKNINYLRNEYTYHPDDDIKAARTLYSTFGTPSYNQDRDKIRYRTMRAKSKSLTTLKSTFMQPDSTDFSKEREFSLEFSRRKKKIGKWMADQDDCFNNIQSESIGLRNMNKGS